MTDTTAGLLQIGMLVAALAVCYRPLGAYMARVFTSERDLRVERVVYRLVGVDPRADQRWSVYAASVLAFSFVGVVALFALQRFQSALPLVPRVPRGGPGAGVQHRGVVRDQHQLAGLLRREHDGPPHADGRARGPELRLGRRRHRGGGRADPRLRPLAHRSPRQLLGRPGAGRGPHPAAPVGAGGRRADPHRRRAEPRLRDGRHHPGRRQPDDPRRPGRLPGGDQGARHQRRRLLQRELRAPLREPDGVEQPGRELPAPADPGQPDPDLRHHGRRQAPGVRDPRHDGGALGRARHRGHHPRGPAPGHRVPGRRRRDGGQGDPAGRVGLVPVRRLHDRHLDRSGQLVPLLLHRRRRRPAPVQHGPR